jgi:hypothetical protein
MNTARISILAISESQYLFRHTGPGLWIVKLTMLTTILDFFTLALPTRRNRASRPSLLPSSARRSNETCVKLQDSGQAAPNAT